MQTEKSIYVSAVVGLLISLFGQIGFAQQASKTQTIFEYLTVDDAAKMTLETDFTTILAQRKSDDYFPAMLTTAKGKTFKVELRPRGKFRRKNCEVPPLKIKFAKKGLKAEKLDTLNEIKLVVPCFDNPLGEELVIKEYLAYRMFEQLTGVSLRARLIRLTIKDTHVEQKRTMLCLLVEDEEELAARLNGREIETYGLPADSLVTHQAALAVMFEYMIGNTDWEIGMLRNVRLVQAHTGGKILVIPYDFDFSGFVGAPYASPSSDSGLKSVRDRFLMSHGLRPEALRRATQILKNSRTMLLNGCESRYLSRETSDQLVAYLETFFQTIDERGEAPTTMRVPLMED